ncbi:energy transducer TonB [Flavobacterium sp.]|uniref:energy transducer TonB n=1 Tax=Flavobacterium sp. TaxID=239 RepID=UPI00286EA482|nr:energy transducer TonB [Flavobacterium sp.]
MSRLSIYETRWIDLVFENKNQEYGAYQLRRDSSRTTVMAFFSGILLIAAFGTIFTVAHLLRNPIIVETNPIIDEPLIVTPYHIEPLQPKTPINTGHSKAPQEPTVLRPMVVATTPDVLVDVPTNRDVLENHPLSSGTESGTGINTTSGTIESPTLPIDDVKEINNTTELDKLPEFPGGINKFYTYVGNNFEKPEIDGINTFRVYVSFIIEKDGSMTDIQVKRDPGFGLGKEAVRVLKSLRTKWSPGMIDSKPVRTAYNLPIVVEMQ